MSWHTESAWVSHAQATALETIAIHLCMVAPSKSNMRAPGEDVNGTPVAVEGRVEDQLVVHAQGHLVREREPVVDLAQHLGTVRRAPSPMRKPYPPAER